MRPCYSPVLKSIFGGNSDRELVEGIAKGDLERQAPGRPNGGPACTDLNDLVSDQKRV